MKTKIIATIGPATLDFKVFQEIIRQGVDYIRINTAYSNEKQHSIIFNNLKKIKSKKDIKKQKISYYCYRNAFINDR